MNLVDKLMEHFMSKALRLIRMLQTIPRGPKEKISSRHLYESLLSHNFDIDYRSVQRDLNELATLFPDLKNDGCKVEIGWYWAKDCGIHQIPMIDPSVALTFKLTDQFLSQLVPSSVKEILTPYFDASEKILNDLGSDKMSKWSDKVRLLPRVQPVIPAKINEEVLHNIYQALFDETVLKVKYKRRSDFQVKEYDLNPLGLVVREHAIYLVATVFEYHNPLHFGLHRFESCELSDEPMRPLDGFSLDELINSGSFEYADVENKMIKLVAIFSPDEAFYLSEAPLSDDQVITKKRDGRMQLTATIKDTRQLRRWLLGFGENVEVIKPKPLRDEFIEITQKLAGRYLE